MRSGGTSKLGGLGYLFLLFEKGQGPAEGVDKFTIFYLAVRIGRFCLHFPHLVFLCGDFDPQLLLCQLSLFQDQKRRFLIIDSALMVVNFLFKPIMIQVLKGDEENV